MTRLSALLGCAIAAVALLAGCGASDSGSGNLSDIPATNTLSTERSTPATTTAPATTTTPISTSRGGGGPTVLESIRSANNVDSSQYHSGAINSGAPTQQTPQFHFSTPSLDAVCSSTTADTSTLVCVGGGAGHDCSVAAGKIVVLTTSGAQQGTCADAAQVLTRSQILPYGNSISFGDFACAAQLSGLFCLDTSTSDGFQMSNGSYRTVVGSQQMPDTYAPTTTSGN